MQLMTTIKPRRDGNVIVRNATGDQFVFKADSQGDLVADVTDAALVAQLLKSEDFVPTDPADYQEASTLVGVASDGNDSARDSIGHTPEGSPPGEGQDEPDDEGDEDAAPVEGAAPAAVVDAATRPSRRRS